MSVKGYDKIMNGIVENLKIKGLNLNLSGTKTEADNSIIDVIYKFSENGWDALNNAFHQINPFRF